MSSDMWPSSNLKVYLQKTSRQTLLSSLYEMSEKLKEWFPIHVFLLTKNLLHSSGYSAMVAFKASEELVIYLHCKTFL